MPDASHDRRLESAAARRFADSTPSFHVDPTALGAILFRVSGFKNAVRFPWSCGSAGAQRAGYHGSAGRMMPSLRLRAVRACTRRLGKPSCRNRPADAFLRSRSTAAGACARTDRWPDPQTHVCAGRSRRSRSPAAPAHAAPAHVGAGAARADAAPVQRRQRWLRRSTRRCPSGGARRGGAARLRRERRIAARSDRRRCCLSFLFSDRIRQAGPERWTRTQTKTCPRCGTARSHSSRSLAAVLAALGSVRRSGRVSAKPCRSRQGSGS